MKKIRNSITPAAGAALLAMTLLAASSPALRTATDDDPAPNPAEVSPAGIDSPGQSLMWQPGGAPANSGGSVPGYKPSSIKPAPSSIIGEDGRVRLTDTTACPNSTIVYINRGGKPYCTGWMISADASVTAGHCVYSYKRQEWTSELEPGPNANGPECPFETATATQKRADVARVKDNDPWLDQRLVKLDKPLNSRTSWFGLTWRSEDYKDTGIELRDYPYDKAPEELWGMDGTMTENRGN